MATVLVTGANRGIGLGFARAGRGEIGPAESAAALVELIDRTGGAESGRFLDRHGRELPW